MIVTVGVSYREAPVAVRERFALERDRVVFLLHALVASESVREAVCLSTCNRVELYVAGAGNSERHLDEAALAVVRTLEHVATERGIPSITPHLKVRKGTEAMRHLCRVAASLDSLVLGEPQILGQVKDAYGLAREAGTLGRYLGRAMTRALHAAKRIRSETAIGAGQVSVSSIAIDLARQIFGDLKGHAALLLGAGEMAEAAAKLLRRSGTRLVVVNRSLDRATRLAQKLEAHARPWDDLQAALVDADVVIASTAAREFVVSKRMAASIMRSRRGRSLFFVDIAVPRNIEPSINQLDNVYVYDIDSLSEAAQGSLSERRSEAGVAEQIIAKEAEAFETWLEAQNLTGTIVALRAEIRGALAAELERSLSGKLRHLAAQDRQALTLMAEAATKKILHTPLTRIKALAGTPRGAELVQAVENLFDLPRDPLTRGGDSADPDSDMSNLADVCPVSFAPPVSTRSDGGSNSAHAEHQDDRSSLAAAASEPPHR